MPDIEAFDEPVLARDDETHTSGTPAHPFGVGRELPLTSSRAGGRAHIDRDGALVEAGGEEAGGLGGVPRERLHLVRVLRERHRGAAHVAVKIPQPYSSIR